MELSGDLSDFALADILQILSLSRKTGTLLLESGENKGRLVIEEGCITHASLVPGETIIDRLVKAHTFDEDIWTELMKIVDFDDGIWSLDTLIIESGILKRKEYESIARRYIEDVVASLMALDKGRFWLELNQVVLLCPHSDIRLVEGLEVEEVLLEAARTTDESDRPNFEQVTLRLASDNVKEEESWIEIVVDPGNDEMLAEYQRNGGLTRARVEGADKRGLSPEGDENVRGNGWGLRAGSRFFSLLMEMRSHSFEAEVSLLIMRFASEGASRGILFVVKENTVIGLGQFGIVIAGNCQNPDEVVRGIVVELGVGSIFDAIVNSGQPYIGDLPEDPWLIEILTSVGGVGTDHSLFLLPVSCRGKTVFVIYGDNYPDGRELSNLDELIALTDQASIVLEKIVLERMVGGYAAKLKL